MKEMNISVSKPQQLPSSSTSTFSRLANIILLSSSLSITTYLLISIFLLNSSTPLLKYSSLHSYSSSSSTKNQITTSFDHLVFGIASTKKMWMKRKDYVRLWWKPQKLRGCVFLNRGDDGDDKVNGTETDFSIPPVCVSGDTSKFRYTYKGGLRSAIRVARIVAETVQLGHSNVRWYVFGDDDTIFIPENLVKTLSKYDHKLWYYIGSNSEIYEQNKFFSFGMAYGGGGFALSSSLAHVLAKVFDSCIARYPHLYGSDHRIFACLTELGVGLTHEPGFHQLDVRGNIFGLLLSHPNTPLLSLHHIDYMDPIFPNMTTPNSLQHLFKAIKSDPERILQQSVCYDPRFSWTVSISWGYSIQVYSKNVLLPDILPVQQTFRHWKIKGDLVSRLYNFDTRKFDLDVCERPVVFFFDRVSNATHDGVGESIYTKKYENCTYDAKSARKLEEIRVFSQKLDLSNDQLKAPRRQCCEVLLPSSSSAQVMDISIRQCKEDELINMHA